MLCFVEWGDLQWQNSLREPLTFWASEVSLQQQALKNGDNLNWLKTRARRNELANMTVWLKAKSSFTGIKPSQGVFYNRNKIQLQLKYNAFSRILPRYGIKFHSQTVFCWSPSLSWTMLFLSQKLNYATDIIFCFCTCWIPSLHCCFLYPLIPFLGARSPLWL